MKRFESMNARVFGLSWGMLLLGVILNVVGVYLIKFKINTIPSVEFNSPGDFIHYFVTLAKFPTVIIGGLAILAAPFPYAVALSKLELSVAYPLSVALNFLLIIPVTVMFLGEKLTPPKIMAAVLIIVSLYLLHR